MIFKNILLHNVAELVPTEDGGYEMLRAPLAVEAALCEQGKRMNRNATGVELRFVINSGTARIKILSGDIYVYYGSIQAGWQTSKFAGSSEPRWIELPLDTERMPAFERITNENGLLYLTGYQRTGCAGCLFGCHLESEPNRLQMLKITHPSLYNYFFDKLDYKTVCDYIGIPY